MRRKKVRSGEKIYRIKTTLSDLSGRVRGQPYRIIGIPGDYTLYNLAEAIVNSFGFGFDHSFGFYDDLERWFQSKEGYELFSDLGEESEFEGVKKTKVSRVFDRVGKRMLFLFDYWDDGDFITELEGIESAGEGERYPAILESIGEAPLMGENPPNPNKEPEWLLRRVVMIDILSSIESRSLIVGHCGGPFFLLSFFQRLKGTLCSSIFTRRKGLDLRNR